MVLSVEDITPELLAQASAAYWSDRFGIRIPGGVFSFQDHEYLEDYMTCGSVLKACAKGSQLGVTTAEVLGVLHGLKTGRYPQGALYAFPTNDDVEDFSSRTFSYMIDGNPDQIGRYFRGTNRVDIKRCGDAYLFLRGARLNEKVRGSAKQSTKLRSIPVDKVVCDEFDLFDEEAEEQILSRLGHSTIQEISYLSNPTVPGYGIDRKLQQSDQRHRWIWCSRCSDYTTCLELSFPDCIREDSDGVGYYACDKCGGPVDRHKGLWIALEPDNEMAGWWMSQLQSFFMDPKKLLARYRDPDVDMANFMRFVMGQAYVESENQLTAQQVYECCGPDRMQDTDRGPNVMGVDVGKRLHVVILRRTTENSRKLLYMGRKDTFEELHDLAASFGVSVACFDIGPETRKVRQFRAGESFAVYMVQYLTSQNAEKAFAEKEGIIKVPRTEVCDETHQLIANGLLILPRRSTREMDQFVREVCNTAKIIDVDRNGLRCARYVKSGRDDYRHALNYAQVASHMVMADYGPFGRLGIGSELELAAACSSRFDDPGSYNPLQSWTR